MRSGLVAVLLLSLPAGAAPADPLFGSGTAPVFHEQELDRRFLQSRIHAGLVRVNGDTTGVDPHAPFGGMKGSSSGSREQGPAAREFYTEIKTVQVNP